MCSVHATAWQCSSDNSGHVHYVVGTGLVLWDGTEHALRQRLAWTLWGEWVALLMPWQAEFEWNDGYSCWQEQAHVAKPQSAAISVQASYYVCAGIAYVQTWAVLAAHSSTWPPARGSYCYAMRCGWDAFKRKPHSDNDATITE